MHIEEIYVILCIDVLIFLGVGLFPTFPLCEKHHRMA